MNSGKQVMTDSPYGLTRAALISRTISLVGLGTTRAITSSGGVHQS